MASKLSTLISALTGKTTPVDADKIPVLDSENSFNHNWLSFSSLKTYLSGLYASVSHAHGNVTNVGAIGSTANLPVITTTSGVLTAGAFGTGATNFCAGNDARLSDARTPSAHTHEGTAILSTGEVGGTKYLREDGDGTSSWQAVPPSVDLAQLHAAALSF